MAGVGAHQLPSNASDVWLTPRYVLRALGEFDLDPCGAEGWPTARETYCLPDDGLQLPWTGRVWLNPPYGQPKIVAPWMRRLVEHGRGTALIFARTETALFKETVWDAATAVLFLEGRLNFYFAHADESAPCFEKPLTQGWHDWMMMTDKVQACRTYGVSKANSGGPSCLVAYGEEDAWALINSGLSGALMWLGEMP